LTSFPSRLLITPPRLCTTQGRGLFFLPLLSRCFPPRPTAPGRFLSALPRTTDIDSVLMKAFSLTMPSSRLLNPWQLLSGEFEGDVRLPLLVSLIELLPPILD